MVDWRRALTSLLLLLSCAAPGLGARTFCPSRAAGVRPGASVPVWRGPAALAGPVMRPGAEIAPAPRSELPVLPAALPLAAQPPVALPAGPAAPAALPGLAEAGAALASDGGAERSGGILDALYGEAPRGVEAFVDHARSLFFPDGRPAAVVARRGGVRPLGVPSDEELREEMALSPLTYPERLRAVVELFRSAGAAPEAIVVQDVGREQKNVYVVKPGRTDRVIVVSAHHDKASVGAGTIDNWSGTTMVINLYQALRDVATEATIVFASFAREEDGLVGSGRYLKVLTPEQRGKIDADVNLDTLAVDGTFSWTNNSSRALLELVKQTAAEGKFDLKEARLWGGDSDSSSFRRLGIAAMTLFGVSPGRIFDIVHSKKDTMAVFSLPHYKNAYLLTLALLRRLDLLPPIGPEAAAI